MPAQIPYTGGTLHIFGGLADWSAPDACRMSYNPERRAYENTLLLKQGFYNYIYAYIPDGSAVPDAGYLEGHHYETGNRYTIRVYHSERSRDYDRRIAVRQIRSSGN